MEPHDRPNTLSDSETDAEAMKEIEALESEDAAILDEPVLTSDTSSTKVTTNTIPDDPAVNSDANNSTPLTPITAPMGNGNRHLSRVTILSVAALVLIAGIAGYFLGQLTK